MRAGARDGDRSGVGRGGRPRPATRSSESLVGARRHAGAAAADDRSALLARRGHRARWRRGAGAERRTGQLHRPPGRRRGGQGAGAGARDCRSGPRRRCMVARPRAWPPDGAMVLAVANALRGELYAGGVSASSADGVARAARPRSVGRRSSWRAASAPDVLVGELPDPAGEPLEGWAGRAADRSAGRCAARAGAARIWSGAPGGAARVDASRAWEPDYGRPAEAQARWETAHGRPLPDSIGSPRLTRRRSSPSSAAASATRGARPASARRSRSAWTFGLVAETSRRGARATSIGREVGGHRRGAQPRGRARVPAARHRRGAAGGGSRRVSAAAGGGGVPRGARVQHLGAGALRSPWLPAGGTARGLLPQPARRTPWCCGWSWSSLREPALIAAGQ